MGDDDVRLRLLRERASVLWDGIEGLPEHKISADSRRRLLKVAGRELKFLKLLADGEKETSAARLSSTNLSHLEAILSVLQHREANGTSAIMQVFHTEGESQTADTSRNLSARDVPTPHPDSSKEAASHRQRGTCTEQSESPASLDRLHINIEAQAAQDMVEEEEDEALVHVDIVCTLQGQATWVSVSGRSPGGLSWSESNDGKSWKSRCMLLLRAAMVVPQEIRPERVLLFFGRGVNKEMEQGLLSLAALPVMHEHLVVEKKEGPEQLGKSVSKFEVEDPHEEDWVLVETPEAVGQSGEAEAVDTRLEELILREKSATAKPGCWFELPLRAKRGNGGDLQYCAVQRAGLDSSLHKGSEILLGEKNLAQVLADGREVVNLDTTALMAMVSELSNGAAIEVAHLSESELKARFRNTWEFMRDQAAAELISPVRLEIEKVLDGRLPVVCRHVYDEFKSIAFTVGGARERERARAVLTRLSVVPNMASARVGALVESGAVKTRHKVAFGTGDTLHAPTVSANMAFVRAVQQRGVPLHFIQHAPRALLGD